MPQYRVIWVTDSQSGNKWAPNGIAMDNISEVMNAMATEGWGVHSVTAGETGGYNGLFITFIWG
ncbi:DUF4177 domain-containing protein [Nocardia heshunensis]